MGSLADSRPGHDTRLSSEATNGGNVADSIIRGDLTVPNVYELLYDDEDDWDGKLADSDAEQGVDAEAVRP
jgi:hypothetical protein